jgi:hypothetical protein
VQIGGSGSRRAIPSRIINNPTKHIAAHTMAADWHEGYVIAPQFRVARLTRSRGKIFPIGGQRGAVVD